MTTPGVANERGFTAIHVGPLRARGAALNNVSVAIKEMAVEGCLREDPTLVSQSLLYDPLTAPAPSVSGTP